MILYCFVSVKDFKREGVRGKAQCSRNLEFKDNNETMIIIIMILAFLLHVKLESIIVKVYVGKEDD